MSAALALALLACADAPPGHTLTLLSPREQLLRLSVDLRGVHPSEAELEAIDAAAVAEDPAVFDDTWARFVDRYLEDERFADRMEEVYNLTLRMRTGELLVELEDGALGGLDEAVVADALADEPLRLVRRIAELDLPITELVLADYTMANPVVARLWGVDTEGDSGWQRGTYQDGRPHAGLLSMTSVWLRYPSAGVNGNRHRANMVSRVLLCDDYLARPVSFSRAQIDALTSGDPEDVIRDTPTCQSCHSSLDPLAGHFFGFWWEQEGGLEEQTTYRPEDEELWRQYSGREPGWFGLPTGNLLELAEQIASDPRFVQCQASTVFEALTQRELSDADRAELATHVAAFEAGGLTLRALVRSIALSEAYRAASTTDPELAQRLTTVKTVSPAQLAGVVEGITGYRWVFDGRDGLTTHDLGLPVLAGGVDSLYVTTPNHEPSVGLVLVQERLAQSAGRQVAAQDLDPNRAGPAKLLAYVTADDTPESNPAAFDAQIRDLYLRVTGEALAADADEPARLVALWKQLYSVEGSAERAWSGVVAVVLRDPRILFY